MQHLLLAISIITLMLIAGDGRRKTSVNSNMSGKVEEPVKNNTESDFLTDETSVSFSRFDMFVY